MFVNIHLRVRVCAVLSCAVPPPVVLSILGQAEQSRAEQEPTPGSSSVMLHFVTVGDWVEKPCVVSTTLNND